MFAQDALNSMSMPNSRLSAARCEGMGEYYFTGTDSSVTKVEYTFGYKKDAEGNLKIVVHHSSLPY